MGIFGKSKTKDDWIKKGSDLAKQGKHKEAVQAYDKAIELDPKISVVWWAKGIALYGQDKYDEALKAVDRALELDPELAVAQNAKKLILDKRGKVLNNVPVEQTLNMPNNEKVILVAEGNQARIELTDTLVRIIEFKRNPFLSGLKASWDNSKIDKLTEIPRNKIMKASVPPAIGQFHLTYTKDGRSRFDVYTIDRSQRPILFRMLEEMFPTKHWYDDDTKMSYIAEYDDVKKASDEANIASKKGWHTTGTSATDGHINLGRTAMGVELFGGLALLAGGSRTKGKITVSYARTPEWLEGHNKSTTMVRPATTVSKQETQTGNQNDVILQLERIAKLKEQGILTEEEFQAQKKRILGTE